MMLACTIAPMGVQRAKKNDSKAENATRSSPSRMYIPYWLYNA